MVALQRLLPALVGRLHTRPHWLEHALLRGRYMRAAARMEHCGTPDDHPLLAPESEHWADNKSEKADHVRQA